MPPDGHVPQSPFDGDDEPASPDDRRGILEMLAYLIEVFRNTGHSEANRQCGLALISFIEEDIRRRRKKRGGHLN